VIKKNLLFNPIIKPSAIPKRRKHNVNLYWKCSCQKRKP